MTAKKKAGRKAQPAMEPRGPQLVGKTPEGDARKEIAIRKVQDEAIERFGEGLPYAREHYMAEIRRDMVRTVESVMSIGRRLIVMKAHEPHGEWLSCLRSIGLEPDNAQRMMAASRKISALPKAAPARHLLESVGAPSKLFDLLALPEDELEEIASGDTAIDPNDIEQMTRSELRKALRELQKDTAAVQERNVKLTQSAERAELATAKARRAWKDATPDEQLTLLRRELDAEVLGLTVRIQSDVESVTSLRKRVSAIFAHGEEQEVDCSVLLAGAFAQVERVLHMLRDEFHVPHLVAGDPRLEAELLLSSGKQK